MKLSLKKAAAPRQSRQHSFEGFGRRICLESRVARPAIDQEKADNVKGPGTCLYEAS